MSYKEDAKHLDDFLTAEMTEQRKCAREISELLIRLDSELDPIKEVISKHRLFFRNDITDGISNKGIVIGGTRDEPLCLIKGGVFSVSEDGDPGCSDGFHPSTQRDTLIRKMVLSDYILFADLKVIKSGFDFVKNFSVDNNPISNRRKELESFLNEVR